MVATVSCIYGLGSPEEYLRAMVALQVGRGASTSATGRCGGSSTSSTSATTSTCTRGKFRVRGDTIEIIPVYEEHAIRIELFGDEIERAVRCSTR